MSNEVTLQQLINKVRSDLSTVAPQDVDPIFFIEKVEIAVEVAITSKAGAGLEITVLNIFKGSVSGDKESSRGNTITITLTPILTIDQQRQLLESDQDLANRVRQATISSLRKSGESSFVGEQE